jgi:pantoate kinase
MLTRPLRNNAFNNGKHTYFSVKQTIYHLVQNEVEQGHTETLPSGCGPYFGMSEVATLLQEQCINEAVFPK